MIPGRRVTTAVVVVFAGTLTSAAAEELPSRAPTDLCSVSRILDDLPPEIARERLASALRDLMLQAQAAGDRRGEAAFLTAHALTELAVRPEEGLEELALSQVLLTGIGNSFAAGVVALWQGLAGLALAGVELRIAEQSLRDASSLFSRAGVAEVGWPEDLYLMLLDRAAEAPGLAWSPSGRPSRAPEAGEAMARLVLGMLHRLAERQGAAEAELTRAAELARELSSPALHMALVTLGSVYRAQGRSDDARRVLSEGLALLDAGPVYASREWALENRLSLLILLADLDRRAGDDVLAGRRLAEADSLLSMVQDEEAIAGVAAMKGAEAFRSGRFEESLRSFSQAADLSERLGSPGLAGMARIGLACSYSMFGLQDHVDQELERAKALEKCPGGRSLLDALECGLGLRAGCGLTETEALACEGSRYGRVGQVEVTPVDEATELELARRERDTMATLLALERLAGIESARGRFDAAIPLLREAAELIEGIAAGTQLDDLLVSYLGQSNRVYDPLVDLLVVAGRNDEAFAYAEQARARALLRLLGNQRLNPDHGADPSLLAAAEAKRARIAALEADARAAQDEARAAAVGRQADAVRAELEELLFRIKLSSPHYAALTRVEPMELAAVQALLPPQATLVSFFVTASRSHAWVVAGGQSELVTVEIGRERLAELVERFRQEIVTRETSPAVSGDRGVRVLGPEAAAIGASVGEDLAQLLLAPLAPHLRTPHLLLIPHDSLHYLPFAALRNPATGRYLVEDFTLSYAPSASVLQLLERRAGRFEGRVLVLGDPATPAVEGLPPLTGARREAAAVARLFGTPARMGTAATETLLRDQARGVDVLHVAAHNVPSPSDPRMSYLAFAPDGRHDGKLEMREVFEELDLEEVDLVVLSACETALGERTGGDEIVGLTRALLYAGAASVMASLWSVDDDASAALMTAFYVRLLNGEPAAAALAAAQRELLAAERTAAPFYWAAFTLVGEPWAGTRGR